jgi:hypothetical protein
MCYCVQVQGGTLLQQGVPGGSMATAQTSVQGAQQGAKIFVGTDQWEGITIFLARELRAPITLAATPLDALCAQPGNQQPHFCVLWLLPPDSQRAPKSLQL